MACLRIQKIGRMHYDRKAYKFLHSSAIQIQNGMRGMAARKAYNHKRQTKAAIGIQVFQFLSDSGINDKLLFIILFEIHFHLYIN